MRRTLPKLMRDTKVGGRTLEGGRITSQHIESGQKASHGNGRKNCSIGNQKVKENHIWIVRTHGWKNKEEQSCAWIRWGSSGAVAQKERNL